MIKINLAPPDELESPYWWLPDAVTLVAAALISFMIIQMILEAQRTELATLINETQEYKKSFSELEPEVAKFKSLKEQIDDLDKKFKALEGITVSKISRYRPIIILEHMQNIKPTGLWFSRLEIPSAPPTPTNSIVQPNDPIIIVEGASLDHVITAEFLNNIKATAIGEYDPADIRTQVFFDNIWLTESVIKGRDGTFSDLKKTASFKLEFNAKERSGGSNPFNISRLKVTRPKLMLQ